jgi:8-oxo-dGTP diphosphatase
MKNDKKRERTRIAVYLVGMRNDHVLLGKRINTDHMNNHWSLPAGHVYEGESCMQAIIREMKEELELILKPNDLQLIGAIHHNSLPYDYMNFIYTIDLTLHHPKNSEPTKCAMIEFYHKDNLPQPIAPYIVEIIEKSTISPNPWIIESGW